MLGVPVGHPSYVRVQLSEIQHDHETLLDRIPSLPDLPVELAVAAALRVRTSKLLSSRGASCFWQRNSRESMIGVCEGVFAESWESAKVSARILLARAFLLLWAAWASEALCGQGQVPSGRAGRIAFPWFSKGTLNWWLISWISWRGFQKLSISDAPLSQLEGMDGVQGFEIPSWRALMKGARPPPRDPEDDRTGKPQARVAARGIISNRAGIQRRAVVPNHQ